MHPSPAEVSKGEIFKASKLLPENLRDNSPGVDLPNWKKDLDDKFRKFEQFKKSKDMTQALSSESEQDEDEQGLQEFRGSKMT